MNDQEILSRLGHDNLSLIRAIVVRGHNLGLSYVASSDILNVASAMSYRQNIINFAIDYLLEEGCKSGDLPLTYSYRYNQRGNCQHIELYTGDMVLTHSSGNHNTFPREALFRKELSSNQLSLFGDVPYFSQFAIVMHSSTLVHGVSPSVALGVPDRDCKSWSNYIDLSLLDSHTIELVNNTDIEKFEFTLKHNAERIQKHG